MSVHLRPKSTFISLAKAREFFVLNEWTEGSGIPRWILSASQKGGLCELLDRKAAVAMAGYLAPVHPVKRRDADLIRAPAARIDRPWRMNHGADGKLS